MLEPSVFWSALVNLSTILIIFAVAWLIYRMSWRIAGLILRINHTFDRFFPNTATSAKWLRLSQLLPSEFITPQQWRRERQQTVQELLASGISVAVFATAILITLGQFVSRETVVLVATLFGTALAFAGRTFIGDFLAGISIIFQDRYDVGEKILVKAQLEIIEGVVEHVSLNATWLRAPAGELYIIANGEMRFIRNYSRGLHSSAKITIKIAAYDLDQALPLLHKLGQEAYDLLPDLREPWQVINETGTLGEHVELTLTARAHYGQAADLRPQLLRLIQERLAQANITLAS
jgi:small-conductance mechanosensitive channel